MPVHGPMKGGRHRDRAPILTGWLIGVALVGAVSRLQATDSAKAWVCPNPFIQNHVLRCDADQSDDSKREAGFHLGAKSWLLGKPLDLNEAKRTDLMLLPRVGYGMAERILRYRTIKGAYCSPTELRRIKGIGPKTYALLKPLVDARCQTRVCQKR